MLHRSTVVLFIMLMMANVLHGQYGGHPMMPPPGICSGRNEQFSLCATTCPQTCDDYRWRRRPKACHIMCRSGCECIPPYVRMHSRSMSPCIHPRQCRFN